MRRFRALFIRLKTSIGFAPDASDDEMREELESHLRMHTADNVRRGMSADDARRHALLASGGMTTARESMRAQYRFLWLEQMIADARYAIRGLAARPLFTSVVVATLALGVGVNVVMFGVLDRTFVRPPRYLKDPSTVHRIYLEWTSSSGKRITSRRTEFPRYTDFARWNRSLSELAAFVYRRAAVGEGEVAREMDVAVVSASFFDFFDAPPVAGRYFTTGEDTPPKGEAVAVLGFDHWRAQYGGSRDVLGKSVMIGTVRYTIIGVAPRGFDGVSDGVTPVAFIPATTYGASMRTNYYEKYTWTYVGMLGRRKPEVSIDATNADLTRTFRLSWDAERRITSRRVEIPEKPVAIAAPVQLDRGPQARAESKVAIWVGGVAAIVLLVACANVANLLLARAVRRRREMAVRLAIGGTPARLMRQVLTESLVLATIGGVAGVLAARAAASAMQRILVTSDESWPVITDGRTVTFAAALALIAAVLSGLFPALQVRGGDLAGSLKAGFREGAYRRSRVTTALLLAQTALSVVLLVGAGLFTRSLDRVQHVRLGYDTERLLYVQTVMRGARLNAAENRALAEQLLTAARSTPGVANGTTAISIPFLGGETQDLFVAGMDSVRKLGRFELQAGSPDYFATMGTKILRGRGLSADDRVGAPEVAVVSEAMGAALWRGEDPIGKCFRIDSPSGPCTTVVGVAENIKARGFDSDAEFHYYLPMSQYAAMLGEKDIELFVRTNGDPAATAASLRTSLQRHMPGASYVVVTPFQDVLNPAMRSWTSGARMFVAFGTLALLVAAIGLYGAIAFAVAHRTQEIGMRIALGAQASNVLGLIVGEGVRVTVAGVAIGTVVALGAANGIEGLLFKISPHDPLVYTSVAATLLLVSMLACVVPAMRAARVDPSVALRSE